MNALVDYKKHAVLYVDDERSNLLVFRHNFDEEFQVITAESGFEALEILKQHSVAVLLADQRMPQMTGVALAERVRNEYPEVVRMILTAYSDIHAAMDAINLGQVWRYITKPWRREELLELLRGGIEIFMLNTMIAELQLKMMRSERLALLGFMAAGIAHDLKSPLTSLSSNLESLEEVLTELDPKAKADPGLGPAFEEIRAIVTDCRDATQTIRTFVESIRLHVREHSPHWEAVDLAKLVDSTVKLCKSDILRRARLQVRHDPAPPVQGDPAQLGQVLLNLLVNALQAIPPGKTSENRVSIHVREEDGRAVVSVCDTGEGIPPERIAKIFEPFFSTKTAKDGTGLGLAIVRDLVERHHGEITVESEVGRGSTFTLRFPAAGEGPLEG
jgi:two-component system NtrC family sensor kinase